MPFVLAAARTGLSLVWKMVVFEVLGSDGGVGFRVGVFQFFDMGGILAYTVCFCRGGHSIGNMAVSALLNERFCGGARTGTEH